MLRNYLLVAWRNLLRQRLFSTLNTAGLAIGIASCIVIGLYVQDELSYDRFHARADRILRVGNGDGLHTPPALGPTLVEDLPEIEASVRFRPPKGVWMLRQGDRVFYERRVYWMDESAFDVFSFDFRRGDARTALVNPYSIVLSESTARRYFGDADPLGKVVRAEDTWDLTVTGVVADMPAHAHFHVDAMVPMKGRDAFYERDVLRSWRKTTQMYTYVLLAEGATAASVRAKLPAFAGRHLTPERREAGYVIAPFLQPITDIHFGSHFEHEIEPNSDRSYMLGLLAIGALILLVACVNYTNLATARFALRAREVGVRKALGSTARQLTRQFLGESVLVAGGAMLLALAMAAAALPSVNGLTGKALSLRSLLDPAALLLLVLVVAAAGLLAGAYPALFLSRFQPVAVLRGLPRSRGGSGLFRRVLVVGQFAVSTVLIVGTVAIAGQLRYVSRKNLGFDKEQVLVVPFSVQVLLDEVAVIRAELLRQAGIVSVSQANTMPGRPGSQAALWPIVVRPEGWPEGRTRELGTLGTDAQMDETLGLRLAAGRFLEERDLQPEAQPVAVVNGAAVRAFDWGTPEAALGRSLENVGGRAEFTIVGVLEDFHFESLHRPIAPLLVVPVNPAWLNHLAIRLRAGAVDTGIDALRRSWAQVYPEYPLTFTFLDEDFDALYRNEQSLLRLFGGFALLAVLTACLGVFGLVTFATERRTREIGIRKALGATARGIVVLLSWEVLALVLVASLAAMPLAWWALERWLTGFAYRASLGPWPFLAGMAVSLALAWIAMSWQAVRAALANPVDALRYE